jgi:hypothetical protein
MPTTTSSPQTAIPFGKYLLIKRLAVGGMAELFLAQEPPNPELVVLKRILPYLSEEPEFLQMFLDEARIAAQMHHPNIVQVYELGKLDNTIFIAMEFVEGVDLRRVVMEEAKFGATVPFGVAAAICAQVAEGLDYAHFSKGVDGVPLELIHRDISPQNVMIAYDGRVKIVDFGIAKAGTYVNRSKPGVIKGKFLYLSPEQVAQEKLDHRADIFALGTMMYEITTGKSPFAKPTTEGILYAIRSEDPSPPHLLKDDYPTELSRIIMRCLLKDRSQRYQRAAEVQADLAAFLASGTIRQSTDIPDYIARLMGEEEERTVLHIPVAAPAARKEATQAMSPGLTSRPARRITGEGAAAPDYHGEVEPPTQMSRPLNLPSQPSVHVEDMEHVDETYEYEDEPEESTAIGTIPVGFMRPEPGESTVQERGRKRTPSSPGAVAAARRSPAPIDRDTEPRARRPVTPPSRRPLTQDDEASQSISLTQPTVNQRLRQEEEEAAEQEALEESEESENTEGAEGAENMEGAESISVTPPTTAQRRRRAETPVPAASVTSGTTGQRRRLANEQPVSVSPPAQNKRFSRQRKAVQEEEPRVDTESGVAALAEDADPTEGIQADLDDDESTAGYEQEANGPRPRSRTLLLAVAGVVLLLVLMGGLFLALSGGSESGETGPLPSVPMTAPTGVAPSDQPTPGTPTAVPIKPAVAAVGATEPSPAAAGTDKPQGGDPAAAAATNPPGGVAGEGTPEVKAGGEQKPGGTPGTATEPATVEASAPTVTAVPSATPPAPPKPSVEVMFKTNFAVLRVNGQKVEANKMLAYPPGKLTVEWSCPPKRKREGSDVKILRAGLKKPYIYDIHCRKTSR